MFKRLSWKFQELVLYIQHTFLKKKKKKEIFQLILFWLLVCFVFVPNYFYCKWKGSLKFIWIVSNFLFLLLSSFLCSVYKCGVLTYYMHIICVAVYANIQTYASLLWNYYFTCFVSIVLFPLVYQSLSLMKYNKWKDVTRIFNLFFFARFMPYWSQFSDLIQYIHSAD